MSEVAYLATPFSHPDGEVERLRWRAVTWTAHWLFQQGQFVYSPITHNIPFSEWGMRGSFDHWCTFDLSMLSRCDKVLVLTLPGWKESIGVTTEIAHAQEKGIPVEHLEPPYEKLEEALGSVEALLHN